MSILLHTGAGPTIQDHVGQIALEWCAHQECVATLEVALVEPQRSRALFKARTLFDAMHATNKARTGARTKGHPAAVQQQKAIAAAPGYLKQRVVQAQELPRLSIQYNDEEG